MAESGIKQLEADVPSVYMSVSDEKTMGKDHEEKEKGGEGKKAKGKGAESIGLVEVIYVWKNCTQIFVGNESTRHFWLVHVCPSGLFSCSCSGTSKYYRRSLVGLRK